MIREANFSVEKYFEEEGTKQFRWVLLDIKERINEQLSNEDILYNCIWSIRGSLPRKILFYHYVVSNIPVGSKIELTSAELKEPFENSGYEVVLKQKKKSLFTICVSAIYRSCFGLISRIIFRLKNNLKIEKNTTLIDSFLTETCLSKGYYIDRNYGKFDLPEKHLYFVTNLIESKRLYRHINIIMNSPNVVLDDFFVSLTGHLQILYKYISRILRPTKVKGIFFMGIDISLIVNNRIKQANREISCYKAIKKGVALDRFYDETPNVSMVYDWNENQNIDRSLISISKTYNIKVIGVRQYFADLNNLELYFTQIEVENDCVPTYLLDVTERHDCLYANVSNSIQVSYIPYYRQLKRLRFCPSINALLVVLPNGLEVSKALLKLVKSSKIKDLEIIIKGHPTFSKKYFKEYAEDYTWIDDTQEFYDLVNRVSHIVTTGSSFLVEAINAGLNVAHFVSNIEISYMPLDLNHMEIEKIESKNDLNKWINMEVLKPKKITIFKEC